MGWRRIGIVAIVGLGLGGLSPSCGLIDDAPVYHTVEQQLLISCSGITVAGKVGDTTSFGTIRYAAMSVTYADRAERLYLTIAPVDGRVFCEIVDDPDEVPMSGDEVVAGTTVDFPILTGLLPGAATVAITFVGVGPCDDGPDGQPGTGDEQEYVLVRPQIRPCDLSGEPPTRCTMTSEPLTCVNIY